MTQMQCAWHRGAQRCKGCRAAGKQQPNESTLHPPFSRGPTQMMIVDARVSFIERDSKGPF